MKRIIVGITGASGSAYFLRVMETLAQQELEIHVIASEQGRKVLTYETGVILEEQTQLWNKSKADIILEDNENLFSPVASGSYRCDAMAVLPCSMSTVAEIACGITKTLLTRAADVMIKERRKLVLVPRETPLSTLHLRRMTELSELGVTILPAMPGFYGHPQTLDEILGFVAGKVLDSLEIENNCYQRWEGNHEK
ncbi:UbiX family flavin prenyltransferase [Caproiciproducens faecalis]|uniref:Flavin prenyltransferase UbiX n=1 Tax=Caproiciproducens faecalis TaxID=2820301 RepID=A0ABS7DTB6_9FIRM|nr:UbiX family flavin prenyltransferase [Caproiciproducens faecalis]MBW7573826.1 UbiX family flavin prenyltransferase [Caproiciproducens faecalis]